jgi:hypothetical protein
MLALIELQTLVRTDNDKGYYTLFSHMTVMKGDKSLPTLPSKRSGHFFVALVNFCFGAVS